MSYRWHAMVQCGAAAAGAFAYGGVVGSSSLSARLPGGAHPPDCNTALIDAELTRHGAAALAPLATVVLQDGLTGFTGLWRKN